ncbi:hypothetical protein SBOR_6451 [Sclerotinia borealis F-4128]|uniref:Uncharacterized protein n=1 Tax=Sclerotinia borealis (strain F-4128) TaxID=1432307 RepID=W9C8U0_SCLBF|nr:hypothetical protein SBOR_6451 [Sclerotinia borealis F-4128]
MVEQDTTQALNAMMEGTLLDDTDALGSEIDDILSTDQSLRRLNNESKNHSNSQAIAQSPPMASSTLSRALKATSGSEILRMLSAFQRAQIQQIFLDSSKTVSACPFLDIFPSELRNKIYGYLLVNPELGKASSIYEECTPILYGRNDFLIECVEFGMSPFNETRTKINISPLTRYLHDKEVTKQHERPLLDDIVILKHVKHWERRKDFIDIIRSAYGFRHLVFRMVLELATKIAIRKQKLLFTTRYEALPREQAMKLCEMAYEKQWWNRFVHYYKEAVDDMDTQYLAIRDARKKLYAWGLASTVREVDVKPMLCDEMVDWDVWEPDLRINEFDHEYRYYPEDDQDSDHEGSVEGSEVLYFRQKYSLSMIHTEISSAKGPPIMERINEQVSTVITHLSTPQRGSTLSTARPNSTLKGVPLKLRRHIWKYLLLNPDLGDVQSVQGKDGYGLGTKYGLAPIILCGEINYHSFLSMVKNVKHWKILFSANGKLEDSTVVSFCRSICHSQVKSIEVMIIPYEVGYHHFDTDSEEFSQMPNARQMQCGISPFHILRNIEKVIIREADLNEMPDLFNCEKDYDRHRRSMLLPDPTYHSEPVALLQSNTEVELFHEIYDSFRRYAQAFERITRFRREMKCPPFDFNFNWENPFRYNAKYHPVEEALCKATLMIHHDEPKLKSGNMAELKSLQSNALRFLERQLKESYQKEFENLQREVALRKCTEAYTNGNHESFLKYFKLAVDDMDAQYLEIRQARKGLFQWDLQRPGETTEIDVMPYRCDERIEWDKFEPDMNLKRPAEDDTTNLSSS